MHMRGGAFIFQFIIFATIFFKGELFWNLPESEATSSVSETS